MKSSPSIMHVLLFPCSPLTPSHRPYISPYPLAFRTVWHVNFRSIPPYCTHYRLTINIGQFPPIVHHSFFTIVILSFICWPNKVRFWADKIGATAKFFSVVKQHKFAGSVFSGEHFFNSARTHSTRAHFARTEQHFIRSTRGLRSKQFKITKPETPIYFERKTSEGFVR